MQRSCPLPLMLVTVLAAAHPAAAFDPHGDPQLLFANAGMGSWSPQGDRICYARIPAGGIVTYEFATRQSVEVSATGVDPAWSPAAGRYIAFIEAKAAPEQP